jgi:hypothetical protein
MRAAPALLPVNAWNSQGQLEGRAVTQTHMATLANIFNRFAVASEAAEAVTSEVRAQADAACRLRALPNEDVYFFVKRIDNSRVVRQADPAERARGWRVVAGGCGAAVLLIGTLLPSAYGLLAGYQINQLQSEYQKLVTQKAVIELEEAALISPERLQVWAQRDKFAEPSPDSIVYITPKTDQALALNRQQ